ncbi:MAG: cation:proton antiporter [Candidatus Aenigmatarchaeota archaeon]
MDAIRLLLDLAILLFFAKIFGEVAERFRISSLVGEISAGILVGPILHWVYPSDFLSEIALIGIIMLLYIIGLETNFDEIKADVYKGSSLAGVACAVSMIGGLLIGEFALGSWQLGLVIGVVMMGTSTAIPVKVMMDYGEFKTRVGRFVVVTAMADDVITLIALAALSTFLVFGGLQIWSVIGLTLAVIGFILVVLTVGSKISDAVLTFVRKNMRDEQILVAIPLIIVIILAFVSERIHIAAVTGAFLAGMAMSRTSFTHTEILPKMKMLGYGIFIPIFFAASAVVIGFSPELMSWDLGPLVSYWWVVVILLVVGVLTKAFASGWFAKHIGFNRREQGIISLAMIPRGEYGIVVAQLAFGIGAITNQLYSALILFILITVIITPILYCVYFRKFGR